MMVADTINASFSHIHERATLGTGGSVFFVFIDHLLIMQVQLTRCELPVPVFQLCRIPRDVARRREVEDAPGFLTSWIR